jgi:hypothetical protein
LLRVDAIAECKLRRHIVERLIGRDDVGRRDSRREERVEVRVALFVVETQAGGQIGLVVEGDRRAPEQAETVAVDRRFRRMHRNREPDLRIEHEGTERVDRVLIVALVEVLDARLPLDHRRSDGERRVFRGRDADLLRELPVLSRFVRVASGSASSRDRCRPRFSRLTKPVVLSMAKFWPVPRMLIVVLLMSRLVKPS